jgi:anti-sigma B factor antagonist
LKERQMTLTLPAALTILQVTKLKAELIAAIGAGEDLELDARGVEEVDAAGLQLLEAAHRSTRAAGLSLRFVPGGRGALDVTAAGVGLRLANDPLKWRELDHA